MSTDQKTTNTVSFINVSRMPSMNGIALEFKDKLERYEEVALRFQVPTPKGLIEELNEPYIFNSAPFEDSTDWIPTEAETNGYKLYAIAETKSDSLDNAIYLVLMPPKTGNHGIHPNGATYPTAPLCFDAKAFLDFQIGFGNPLKK